MNMSKESYNWWTDPKNKEEVYRHSWWEHPENQTTVELPISIVEGGGQFTACTNDKTKALLGPDIHGVSSGKTREEAIANLFNILRIVVRFYHDRELKYSRWVPLKIGPWNSGGNWFSVFGLHISFRYGNGMKGGWYIPFTRLNISAHSEWRTYNRWKNKKD